MSQQVTSLLYNAAGNQIVCVTGDQNLLMVDGDTLALKKTLVGYNDDIIDVKYVPSSALDGTTSSKIAVATNSEQV